MSNVPYTKRGICQIHILCNYYFIYVQHQWTFSLYGFHLGVVMELVCLGDLWGYVEQGHPCWKRLGVETRQRGTTGPLGCERPAGRWPRSVRAEIGILEFEGASLAGDVVYFLFSKNFSQHTFLAWDSSKQMDWIGSSRLNWLVDTSMSIFSLLVSATCYFIILFDRSFSHSTFPAAFFIMYLYVCCWGYPGWASRRSSIFWLLAYITYVRFSWVLAVSQIPL